MEDLWRQERASTDREAVPNRSGKRNMKKCATRMTNEARDHIANLFCARRKLAAEHLSYGLRDMVVAASALYFLMLELLGQLDPTDPTGGLVAKMIERTYDTVAGCICLIALGQLREAEILSRTVLESSSTISFIVRKDPAARMEQFFRAYIREEREQNRKWEKELSNLSDALRLDHLRRIEQKNRTLDGFETLIEAYAREAGVGASGKLAFPIPIERFSEIGRLIVYRTVYAAMCSQAHHDAEDVLNHFLAYSVEPVDFPDLPERIERQTDGFSIYMVLCGLEGFAQTMVDVFTWMKFPTAANQALISYHRIVEEIEVIVQHLDGRELPKNWLVSR